jgi:hypothetical protein
MSTTKVPASRMVDHNIGSYCFRNKIINGDMRIDQRNAGAASTNVLNYYTYSVDRWTIGSDGAATTSQRITDPITGSYSLRVTGAAGNTAISFNQRIESQNSLELVNKVVNLSFDSFASVNTTLQWIIQYPTSTDSWTSGLGTTIASGAVNVTTTRTTFNTGPINLNINVSNGLLVRFYVLSHTAGKTIDLTNVQLEVGPTATPFEYRPIGTELALCQRYYYKSPIDFWYDSIGRFYNNLCTIRYSYYINGPLPVTMRISGQATTLNFKGVLGTNFNVYFQVTTAQPNFIRWRNGAGAFNPNDTNEADMYMTYTADAEIY